VNRVCGRWVRFGFDLLLVRSLLLSSYVLIPHWRAVGFATAYAVAFFVVAGGFLPFAPAGDATSFISPTWRQCIIP
jgi:hypothetical protein